MPIFGRCDCLTPLGYVTRSAKRRDAVGSPGAASLAQIINGALGSVERCERMRSFFEGVGSGNNAGIWEDVPQDRPEFRKRHAARMAKKPESQEAVGC